MLEQPGSVIAMAHRGGALHPELPGAENTLHAFEHAVALGYDYLETDVHATSDGVLLRLPRRRPRPRHRPPRADRRLSAADVALARIGGAHAVPLMADLLEAFRTCRFNIDLKSAGAVPALAELLDRTGAHDRVCIGSFSQRRLDAVPGRAPEAGSRLGVARPRSAPSSRCPRRAARLLTRGRVAALQVPHRRGPVPVVTAALVRRAHASGAHVHVWTVDDAEEMHELLDLGVDGLITDRTDVLKDVLIGRGQWRDPA